MPSPPTSTRGRASERARRQPSVASASSELCMRLDISTWPPARMTYSLVWRTSVSAVPSGDCVRSRISQGFMGSLILCGHGLRRARGFCGEAGDPADEVSVPPVPAHRRLRHRWVRRTKKDRLPAGGDETDRARFAKLRDYLLRLDEDVTCKACGKRFEIPSQHSLMFVDQLEGLPNDEELEQEIAASTGEAERAPEARPALPARFTRKPTGWK